MNPKRGQSPAPRSRASRHVPLSPAGQSAVQLLEGAGYVMHICCSPGGDGRHHTGAGVCVADDPRGGVLVGWSPHPAADRAQGARERQRKTAELVSFLQHQGYRAAEPFGYSVRVVADPDALRPAPERMPGRAEVGKRRVVSGPIRH